MAGKERTTMSTSVPTHSGSRWEPLTTASDTGLADEQGRQALADGPAVRRRGLRPALAVVAAVLTFGGAGAVAWSQTASGPDSPSASNGDPAGAQAGGAQGPGGHGFGDRSFGDRSNRNGSGSAGGTGR
jgi:hypothetical protein